MDVVIVIATLEKGWFFFYFLHPPPPPAFHRQWYLRSAACGSRTVGSCVVECCSRGKVLISLWAAGTEISPYITSDNHSRDPSSSHCHQGEWGPRALTNCWLARLIIQLLLTLSPWPPFSPLLHTSHLSVCLCGVGGGERELQWLCDANWRVGLRRLEGSGHNHMS